MNTKPLSQTGARSTADRLNQSHRTKRQYQPDPRRAVISLFHQQASRIRRRCRCLCLLIFGLCLLASSALAQDDEPDATAVSLVENLESIAAEHGIAIQGIQVIEETFMRPVRGTPLEQLQYLLADYNYLLTQDFDGTIERVVILKKKPGGPQPIILKTARQGNHHVVQGAIGGYGQVRVDVSLLVDTGADYVVLPESLMEKLSLDPETYESRTIQTANGKIDALFGPLPILQLGAETLVDVDTAFIEDDRLEGTKLLGMSVLGRYRMTIDDKLQRITLIKPH